MSLLKPSILLLALFGTSLAPLTTQTRRSSPAGSASAREQDVVREIKTLEDGLRIAMVKGEASWWNTRLSSEYTETDATGKVRNKDAAVAAQLAKTLIYDTLNFGDRTLRTFNGDTVIVTGRVTAQGSNQGQSFNADYQFTRVWVKQGLEWKLASQQETRIAP
jgi:hypothetical protein